MEVKKGLRGGGMRFEFHYANLAKHDVSPREVRECLTKGVVKYLRKVGRKRYQVIAQTFARRYLEIIYEDRETERFVFHAMDARDRDIRLLKRRGKRR